MKIIAFDIGFKKIGSAIGDMDLKIAFPYKLLNSLEEIIDLINKENPEVIIIGHPKINENDFSEIEEYCVEVFNIITDTFPSKKIILIDERFTSEIAKEKIKKAGVSYKEGKNSEDSISAQIILETYFLKNGNQ